MRPGTPGVAVALLSVVLIFVCARQVDADGSTSVIRVTVRAPAAGDTVEVAPESGGRARESMPLDAQGVATIRNLRPGRYVVSFRHVSGPGIQQVVRVGTGELLVMEVTRRAGFAPEMTIAQRVPRLHGTEFQAPELQDFPAADNLTTLLETAAPFVIVDRFSGGGLDTARSGLVGTRGASWTQSTLRFGDADFKTPTLRGWTIVPDLALAESVAVRYGNLPLAVGAPGAAISIEPRRPSAAWQNAMNVSFTTPKLVSESGQTVAPTIVRLDSFASLGMQTGGPIRKGVGLLVSAFGSRGVQHERDRPAAMRSGIGSATGLLIATPTRRDEVRVLAAAQRIYRPFEDRRQFLDRGVTERDTNSFAQLTWDRVGETGSFHEISFGVQHGAVFPRIWSPAVMSGGTVERVFEGPLPDPASAMQQRNWNVRMRYAPAMFTWAERRHQFEIGLSLDRTSLSSRQIAAPPVAELVSGFPARVWIPDPVSQASARRVTDASVFLSDHAALSGKVTLDLGVRAALSRGSADGAVRGISWRSVSPRAAVRIAWPIAVSAGFARYQRPVSLGSLAFGDPGAPLIRVYRWQDPNGDRQFAPSEQGTLIALAGRNGAIASVARALAQPDMWEAYLGFERQLTRTMRLGATFNVKRGHNLSRSVNVGVSAAGYQPVTVIDPAGNLPDGSSTFVMFERSPSSFGRDRYELTTVPNDDMGYEGVDLTWVLRTKRWYSMLGATAYAANAAGGNRGFGVLEADYGVIGEHFETPNTTSGVSVGKLFFDRDYVGKWSTSYLGPRGLVVSLTARYQDGQAFSLLLVGPNLAQGADLISADRPGATRFTFTGTIDARVEKRFGPGGQSAVGIDVFNLTNRADEVEENPIGDATFRLATALQPPRTVRVHVRLIF